MHRNDAAEGVLGRGLKSLGQWCGLWRGEVADPTNRDRQTQALRALNKKIHDDPRVTALILPVGDGLTLARKLTEVS